MSKRIAIDSSNNAYVTGSTTSRISTSQQRAEQPYSGMLRYPGHPSTLPCPTPVTTYLTFSSPSRTPCRYILHWHQWYQLL